MRRKGRRSFEAWAVPIGGISWQPSLQKVIQPSLRPALPRAPGRKSPGPVGASRMQAPGGKGVSPRHSCRERDTLRRRFRRGEGRHRPCRTPIGGKHAIGTAGGRSDLPWLVQQAGIKGTTLKASVDEGRLDQTVPGDRPAVIEAVPINPSGAGLFHKILQNAAGRAPPEGQAAAQRLQACAELSQGLVEPPPGGSSQGANGPGFIQDEKRYDRAARGLGGQKRRIVRQTQVAPKPNHDGPGGGHQQNDSNVIDLASTPPCSHFYAARRPADQWTPRTMQPNAIVEVKTQDGRSVRFGNGERLAIIAGPCQLESRSHALETAHALREIADRLRIGLVYKTSFDKANRTSAAAARGIGLDEALPIFAEIREVVGLPVLTDVHEVDQCARTAQAVDILQIPAFLSRQTDLIVAAAVTGRALNIKKGQFLAPWDMKNVIAKSLEAGNPNVMACERGVSFGYNTLVSDMRALPIMSRMGCPVVFDATHSVMQPGGQGDRSGGQREFVPVLARAAVAVGVAAVFMETHPDPDSAPSDGPNMVPMREFGALVSELLEYDLLAKRRYARESA